jgi:hypothetical protein
MRVEKKRGERERREEKRKVSPERATMALHVFSFRAPATFS